MEQKKDNPGNSRTDKKATQYSQWHNTDYIPETEYFSFVVSRTEKLSAAIYMVTSLIPDDEPIKYTIRQQSVSLLTYVTGSRTYPVSERLEGVTKTADAITEIISLLHIARAGSLISEMNYRVLADEYQKLQSFIADKLHVQTPADTFLETLFSGEDSQKEHIHTIKDINKGHTEYQNVLYNLTNGKNPIHIPRGDDAYKRHENKKKDKNESVKTPQPRAATEEVKEKRQKIILDLVKRHGEINVKDVSAHITDCSEKTVQRELLALVKDKKLVKEGEKRWSKYRLKTSL